MIEELDALTKHIITMRNRVCPRTSYATSGAAASVLYAYIPTYTSNSGSGAPEVCAEMFDRLMRSGEFSKVEITYSTEKLKQQVRGNVLLLYYSAAALSNPNAADILETVNNLFATGRTKLCIFIEDAAACAMGPIAQIKRELFTCYALEHQQKQPRVISVFNYKGRLLKQSNSSSGFNGQPTVQSRSQFHFLWRQQSAAGGDGKERVLQRLADRAICSGGSSSEVKLSTHQWDAMVNELLRSGKDDYAIYSFIREKVIGKSLDQSLLDSIKSEQLQATAPVEEEVDGRANHLVHRTLDSVPPRLLQKDAIRLYLDYGCAEGAITAALGKELGLPPDRVLGADVRVIPSNGFTFVPLTAEEDESDEAELSTSDSNRMSIAARRLRKILPTIRDQSIDLITTAMVFHHVTHIESVLLELRRVIAPDGALVIREHDCGTPDIGAFLDITHGLYSLSWSDPVEWPDFIAEYKAFYRTREQWTDLLARTGFVLRVEELSQKGMRNYTAAASATRKANGYFPNVIRAYYAVYRPNPSFHFPVPPPQPPQPDSAVNGTLLLKRRAPESDATMTQEVNPSTKSSRIQSPHDRTTSAPAMRRDTEGNQLFESKKYPGRFYRINQTTGATEWVRHGH